MVSGTELTRRWDYSHNDEFHNFESLVVVIIIIIIIKSKRMRLLGVCSE